MNDTIIYRICATQPATHLFNLECLVHNPNPSGQVFILPAWIPGSYMIRDFAKHIINFKATDNNNVELSVEMLDKQTWQVMPSVNTVSIKITYQVFAFDLTPRGAHLDNTHAFFNGSRVFMYALGFENNKHILYIDLSSSNFHNNFKVATTLPKAECDKSGFGKYQAVNYLELLDHPIEIGNFIVKEFYACDVPHKLIITGKCFKVNFDKLITDLINICEYQIKLFDEKAPFTEYMFLLNVFNDAYGGLEHSTSSVIHIDRDSLPKIGEDINSENYIKLLGLFSHEYFHAWNVKRIKPKQFKNPDLTKESYTKQLWIFEGITSYYDDLSLVRSKCITIDNYLSLIEKNITATISLPGRTRQTLEQSSFEAWTKFYKPDENTPNAVISYYTQGSLVALMLDLWLRHETRRQCSLDTIMRSVWQEYGITALGLEESDFENHVAKVSGRDATEFFAKHVRSTVQLPYVDLFATLGIDVKFSSPYPKATGEIGIKLKQGIEAIVQYVYSNGSAEAAGLAPNDVIIAVNGIKVDKIRLETLIQNCKCDEVLMIHCFRRDELMEFSVLPKKIANNNCKLNILENMSQEQKDNFNQWLFN